MPRDGCAADEQSAPTGCSSTANGTCDRYWASTPAITTATARTSPASNDHPTTTAKRARRWILHKLFFEEEAELPAALLHTVRQRRSEFENILKTAVTRHLAATGIILPTTPTAYVNTCLRAANWVYKWYDPHGGEDPQTLGEHIAALVLHALLHPAPPRDTDLATSRDQAARSLRQTSGSSRPEQVTGSGEGRPGAPTRPAVLMADRIRRSVIPR